jgi:hypothetical protein
MDTDKEEIEINSPVYDNIIENIVYFVNINIYSDDLKSNRIGGHHIFLAYYSSTQNLVPEIPID